MRRYIQLLFVVLFGIILTTPLVKLSNPSTMTLREDTQSLYNGDTLVFSNSDTKVTIEATNDDDDTFVFIGDEKVIEGKTFANGHIAEFLAPKELKLVEGQAKIRLISESEFTYTYTPGQNTRKSVLLAFFVVWIIASFLACLFIEFIADTFE